MRRTLSRCFLACLLTLLLPALSTAEAASRQVFTHLFIVPALLPDGAEAAPRLAGLESWLNETFGGYTRLAPGQGGWKNETGQVESETNTVYLVTASRNLSKDIAARLSGEFGVRVPYVLVFPAELFVK